VNRAITYWTEVASAIPDWQKVKDGVLAAPALRQEKICTHSIVLRALGGVGNALFLHHPNDWRKRVQGLSKIDWRKSIDGRVNPLWDNVCIIAGSVVTHRQANVATLASCPLQSPQRSRKQWCSSRKFIGSNPNC